MKLKAITLNTNDLSCFEDSIQKEWLITNEIGGYASSTVLGINTRKYHGLLVSALKPPGSRTVLLEKLDEDITVDNQISRFGSNEFENTIFPNGHKYIKEFSINPYPTFIYENNNIELKKTIFMPANKNAVFILYNICNNNSSKAVVKIYPLLNCRNFHKVTNFNNSIKFYQNTSKKFAEIFFPNSNTKLILLITTGRFIEKTNWVKKIQYRKEKYRGESSIDNCFQPGFFKFEIRPKITKKFYIIALSKNIHAISSIDLIKKVEPTYESIQRTIKNLQKRNDKFLNTFYLGHKEIPRNNWLTWLILATKNFTITNKKTNNHILAGYHWFGPWGRDTFISFPGLLLITKRFSAAKKILLNYSMFIKKGLIPNFQQNQKLAYNTVDASLWYMNAILQFIKYTGDFDFIKKKLWNKILEIMNSYETGTKLGIKMDHDGLLMHGPQLTWMDAVVNGKPITPRAGKAVEIQTLWYNALKVAELIAINFEETSLANKYSDIAKKTKLSFNKKFWNYKRNCLFDVRNDNIKDSSIRPNQIFSLSLDFMCLNENKADQVLDVVNSYLLTPFGLRTLEKDNKNYIGKYVGDRKSRDLAYHNGTIWPWLFGPFITAYFKFNQNKKTKIKYKKLLNPLLKKHIMTAGLGHVSEIFDGDPPHKPRGCISQAWSIAEPLRAYVEDILNIKPDYKHIIS